MKNILYNNKTKKISHFSYAILAVVIFTLIACQNISENKAKDSDLNTNSLSSKITTQSMPVTFENLMAYHWYLNSATDRMGKPISELTSILNQSPKRIHQKFQQLANGQVSVFHTASQVVSFSIGCNGMSKGVSLNAETLTFEKGIASTTMGCPKLESNAESKISTLLSGENQLKITNQSPVILTQITENQETLIWRGEPLQ